MSISQIEAVLCSMDVPDLRRDLDNFSNVRWLLRKLPVRNRDHPSCQEIMEHLQALERKMVQDLGLDADGAAFRL